MRTKPLCLNSASIYFSSLAIVYLLILYFGLVPELLDIFHGINIRHLHEWLCKIKIFQQYSFSDSSNWILLAVTTDRFIAVWFPFKAKKMNTAKRAKCVVLALIMLAIVKNVHIFWTRGKQHKVINNTYVMITCGFPNEHYEHFSLYIRPWIALTMYAFIPIGGVLILNILIVFKIRKLKKSTNKNTESHMKGMTWMLVGNSVAFLMFVTPSISLFVSRPYWVGSVEDTATYSMLSAILDSIFFLNHACNFFFYCLGSRVFRQQLVRICTRGRVNPVEDNIITTSGGQNQYRFFKNNIG